MTRQIVGAEEPPKTDYDSVQKRVNDVVADIVSGRVIRPQRKILSDALDRAKSGDSVHDALRRNANRGMPLRDR